MRALATVCVGLLFAGVAQAQDAACPSGNLLAGKRPTTQQGGAHLPRLTDNTVSAEGDPWNTVNVGILSADDSFVVYDLGQLTRVDAVYIQADNNDTYQIDLSTDGAAYEPVWTVPMHPNPGMRARTKQGLGASGRYLRVGNARGDRAYSMSEVQAFCGEQALWPPPVKEKKVTKGKGKKNSRKARNARGKMTLAAFGLVIFLGLMLPGLTGRTRTSMLILASGAMVAYVSYRVLQEKGVPQFSSWGVWLVALVFLGWLAALFLKGESGASWARRGALSWLVLCSATVWINYGTFHGSRAVHYWDSFHYYMGSKYFKEVRYDYLYACSNIGEIDDGQKGVMKRHIRDLRNNALLPAKKSLENMSTICHERFTPERWAAFRQDLRLFRSFMGSAWWAKMFKDHGYNATPVWNMTGNLFANWDWESHLPPEGMEKSPANLKTRSKGERKAIDALFKKEKTAFEGRIKRLAAIDFLLYGLIFALIFWAFGLRTCALAMLIWAVGYPWAYFWTGGRYGRVPWLFMGTAALCLLKKGYPLLAGFAFTWTALLRVFPGALIGGLSAVIGDRLIRWLRGEKQVPDGPSVLRGISKPHRRLIAGCALGLAVLVPASLPSSDGAGAYKEFLDNSFKHKGTPLTNHMGLPTLLSYHPKYVGRHTKNAKLDDPFLVWKQKRKSTLASRKWAHYGIILLTLIALGWAGRRLEDWEVTAASVLLCVSVFELTCYYYNFIVIFVPLAMRHVRYVVALIAMAFTTQVLQQQVGWYDEQYTAETALVYGTMLWIFGDICYRLWRSGPEPAAEPDEAPPDAEAAAA